MARLSRFDREVVELACARVLLDIVRSLWIGMGVAEEYARGTGPDGPLHACARPPRVNQTKGSRPVSGLARDALTVAGAAPDWLGERHRLPVSPRARRHETPGTTRLGQHEGPPGVNRPD